MKLLEKKKLADLASALAAKGWRVVAPIADGDDVRLKEWAPGADIRLAEVPANSAKDFLFPRSEVIARYKIDGNDFAPEPVEPEAPKTVVLGARPCDAASLAALDTVFNWDYKDAFYNTRRAALTLVTLACTSARADDQCFCTSVGGSPDSTRGADAVLRSADGGAKLIFEPLTDKGKALAADAGQALADGEAKADPPADVPVRFSSEAVTEWLKSNFESPLWKDFALACLGCGACAYACPTCHCFDIQDEGSRRESVRYRNWDACGLALFTLHASGHNPRPDQSSRWRQRVMHKFSYFPDRFGMLACTGCGRCARLCPAGMAIAEVCEAIEQASKVPVK
jgi:ferredoxin